MPESPSTRSLAERLDLAVEALLARPAADAASSDVELAPLLDIAQHLRGLPRESFKLRLKSELERKSSMATQAQALASTRQTATPRLRIRNAAAAIEFYKQAFGAKELMRFVGHGQIGHAEITIGNSIIMLCEASPDHGYPGPESLGGSPVTIQMYVEDADALVKQAVEAGARLVSPVTDQFYGDRSGSVADPFGYTWGIATHVEDMSLDEMHRRFEAMAQPQPAKPAVNPVPEGYRTITAYPVVQNAPAMIDFVRSVFDAEERFRTVGSAGGLHVEVRIGDSMLMLGGGGPDLSWRGESQPMAFHVYVPDIDAVYERALKAGAVSIQPPADQPYGERSASVKDPQGNHWYIATAQGATHIPEGLSTVTPYLHPLRAEPVIRFLKNAFGAEEVAKYASPEGVVHHAKIRIGDAILELGEAQGSYQPMPGMFYLYVPDVDASYQRALQAGSTSIGAPVDHSYGDRSGGVTDVFGNKWYLATHIGTP